MPMPSTGSSSTTEPLTTAYRLTAQSSVRLPSGMRIAGAFIANHAEWREHLLFVSGAFPEWWDLAEIPGDASFMLVLMAEVTHQELEQQHTVDIAMLSPDGVETPLLSITFVFGPVQEYVEGAPIYAPALIPMQAHIENVGPNEFVVRHEGVDLANVRLAFRLAPTG
jgi:hypothetical protein